MFNIFVAAGGSSTSTTMTFNVVPTSRRRAARH
jgi:hypothetical protein